MSRMKQVELLAPAGAYESMTAAFQAGADAVYIGGRQFGARAYADNTTDEQLLSAIDYAHLQGKALYLTVNTLVKENELDGLCEWLRPFYENGLDAVIVQDLGVFSMVKRHFPGMDIHASTQMTVTGPDGAALLKEMGATRVVPARELTVRELKALYDATGMEVEAFVHGALCYGYSGQCLLSSVIGGRSGNRGRCAQACRLPYTAFSEGRPLNRKDEQYLISLKDLCGLDVLPDMLDAGVYSLKIEGRMKSPQYTAGVASVYRKYVDHYLEYGREGYRVKESDRKILSTLFDRGGTTDGYLRGVTGRQMITLKEKPAMRIVDERLTEYINREYLGPAPKRLIDGVARLVLGEPVSLTVTAVERNAANSAVRGIPTAKQCLEKDEEAVADEILTVTVTGSVIEPAQRQPLSVESVEKQLRKTGTSEYEWRNLEIQIEGDGFLPVQELNRLRREAFEQLTESALKPFRRALANRPEITQDTHERENKDSIWKNHGDTPALNVYLEDISALPALLVQNLADGYYLPLETLGEAVNELPKLAEQIHRAGRKVYLAIPTVFQKKTREFVLSLKEKILAAKPDGLLVRTMDSLAFCKNEFPEIKRIGDYSLYTYNQKACETALDLGISGRVLPVELTFRELEAVKTDRDELIVYGRLPVMFAANCIRKTTTGCTKKPEVIWLKDRKGKRFPVKNHCAICSNTFYNSSPLHLLDCTAEVGRIAPAAIRLNFTTEDNEMVCRIVEAYDRVYKQKKTANYPLEDFTRGHYRRGME